MKFLHFGPGPTPDESLPMTLASKVFAGASRWKKNATMNDLRYGVVVVEGQLETGDPAPHYLAGKSLCVPLERGEKVRIAVGRHRLMVGLTRMGHWRYSWTDDVELDDRPPARDIAGWDRAVDWVCTGERGLSSEAMCRALFGIPMADDRNEQPYPRDPDDLRRCRLFLEAVPEARSRMGELSNLSPTWKAYVEHWDEMNRLFNEEAPLGRLMKTASLMRQLQSEVA